MNSFTNNLSAPVETEMYNLKEKLLSAKLDLVQLSCIVDVLQERFEWRDYFDEVPEIGDVVDLMVSLPTQTYFLSSVTIRKMSISPGSVLADGNFYRIQATSLSGRSESVLTKVGQKTFFWKPHVKPGEEFQLTQKHIDAISKAENKLRKEIMDGKY